MGSMKKHIILSVVFFVLPLFLPGWYWRKT